MNGDSTWIPIGSRPGAAVERADSGMLDFTSALYLGMTHSHESLTPWSQLTTGRPAALHTPIRNRRVAAGLAELVGCEEAALGPSTLHLFWDLFGSWSPNEMAIYLDAGVYPIVRSAAERAAAPERPLRTFAHHDPAALQSILRHTMSPRYRPIVVTDGFCPGCGNPAPLAGYHEVVRAYGGQLLIDDTQALGILGDPCEGSDTPYGKGGGGSLRWTRVSGPEIIVVSSLAKGFGAPLAVVAGRGSLLRRFESRSETRVHSSPPCAASVHAAEQALAENQSHGDALRSRLAKRIDLLKRHSARMGLTIRGRSFPVQTLGSTPNWNPRKIYRGLLDSGVRTVLHRSRCGEGASISFLITAVHRSKDIVRLVRAITDVVHSPHNGDPLRERRHESLECVFRSL